MGRILALLLAVLMASPAWAQAGIEAPPPPPDDEPQAPQPPPSPPPPPSGATPGEMGYYDSCFGVPRAGAGPFAINVSTPIPIGATSPGFEVPSLPSGSSNDKAWLVLAVAAAVVLPVVVYAVDDPAPAIVLQRFACPTFSMAMYGGADNGDLLGGRAQGYLSTRFQFGLGHVATDIQYDGSSDAVSQFAAHLLLRPTPRAHIEGGLALGYRRSFLHGFYQEGFEIGAPHTYAFWRNGLSTFGLEVRPMLMLGRNVEPSLEAAFLIPVAQVLQFRLGGRVYSFAGEVMYGFSGGLTLTL